MAIGCMGILARPGPDDGHDSAAIDKNVDIGQFHDTIISLKRTGKQRKGR